MPDPAVAETCPYFFCKPTSLELEWNPSARYLEKIAALDPPDREYPLSLSVLMLLPVLVTVPLLRGAAGTDTGVTGARATGTGGNGAAAGVKGALDGAGAATAGCCGCG